MKLPYNLAPLSYPLRAPPVTGIGRLDHITAAFPNCSSTGQARQASHLPTAENYTTASFVNHRSRYRHGKASLLVVLRHADYSERHPTQRLHPLTGVLCLQDHHLITLALRQSMILRHVQVPLAGRKETFSIAVKQSPRNNARHPSYPCPTITFHHL
jgi:hypothetical protein